MLEEDREPLCCNSMSLKVALDSATRRGVSHSKAALPLHTPCRGRHWD